jgi:lysyl-tRNA synthetase class 1
VEFYRALSSRRRNALPKLGAMVGYAMNYYRDFVVAPTRIFREPTDTERAALQDLRDA